ncbi:MAG: FtsX-like permease family protein [Candidatus Eisenbacteria bacterium]|nr:FtsX-like permease family protein [Candidatus Latescibacterota bacterium]MBD3301262.1 FtsX-like permease family protein [Candidatus Eisenbacteria bacterium]
MSYEFFVARRHLIPHRGRIFLSFITMITVMAVTLGVTALLIVLAVMNGFETEVKERIVGTNAHVIVLRFGDQGLGRPDSLAEIVRRVPDVEAVAPFVYGKAMMTADGRADGGVIKGILPELKDSVTATTRYIETVPGAPPLEPEPGGTPGIILGVHLADALQLSIGERLQLISPKGMKPSPVGFVPKVRSFVLSGVFRSGMYEYDAGMGFIHLREAQEFFDLGDRVTALEVRVARMYEAPRTAEAILSALGGFPYRTNDWIGLNANLFSWMRTEKQVMFLILALIILVAAFNIASVQIMMVKFKRREIGILKSMGASRASIRKLFVLQGISIGGTGMAIGTVLGLALCWALDRYEFIKLPGDIYFIDSLPVRVEALDIVVVEVAVLVLCVLATLLPAWWASRFDPVEAIRHE